MNQNPLSITLLLKINYWFIELILKLESNQNRLAVSFKKSEKESRLVFYKMNILVFKVKL